MKTFTQKKLFARKEFVIEADGVFASETSYFSDKKYKVHFHSMSDSPILFHNFPKKWFIATLLFGLWILFQFYLSIAEIDSSEFLSNALFLAFPFAFCLAGFFKNNNRYIVIDGKPDAIFLFENKPNKIEVNNFVDSIYEEYQNYLDKHYSIDSELSTIHKIERLAHLLSINAITQEEYDSLKNKIIEQQVDDDSLYGFSLN